MTLDPYVDPGTGVLINSLGITDAEVLRRAIADISAARLDELGRQTFPGLYDLTHLRRFHKRIFGDVFQWAGEIRTVSIFKDTGFCQPQSIESYATTELAKLARDGYLRDLKVDDFVAKLAHYYAEVNELHPFREGNGRAQRAFFRQLAAEAGYQIDWTQVDAEDNTNAAIAAHQGNLAPLTILLAAMVRPTTDA